MKKILFLILIMSCFASIASADYLHVADWGNQHAKNNGIDTRMLAWEIHADTSAGGALKKKGLTIVVSPGGKEAINYTALIKGFKVEVYFCRPFPKPKPVKKFVGVRRATRLLNTKGEVIWSVKKVIAKPSVKVLELP